MHLYLQRIPDRAPKEADRLHRRRPNVEEEVFLIFSQRAIVLHGVVTWSCTIRDDFGSEHPLLEALEKLGQRSPFLLCVRCKEEGQRLILFSVHDKWGP